MKKLFLGLIAVVLCLSSFKGMAQDAIRFTEDEDMVFQESLNKMLGTTNVVVAAGNYEIKFDESNPNGYVVFKLTNYEGPEIGVGPVLDIRIRIAVRKRKCGGNEFYSSCLCGIGFRCGTVTEPVYTSGDDIGDNDMARRYVSTNISINPSEKTVTFKFANRVNWEELNN